MTVWTFIDIDPDVDKVRQAAAIVRECHCERSKAIPAGIELNAGGNFGIGDRECHCERSKAIPAGIELNAGGNFGIGRVTMYRKTYKKTRFRPKRPIRSFRDLEVYQRTSQLATEVYSKIIPSLEGQTCPVKDKLSEIVLNIPSLIAVAHSRRFEGDELRIMEECLEACNKTVVYLEQARDIFAQNIDKAACEDMIKRYIYVRRKTFNLYKAWKRFQAEHAHSRK